MVTERCFFVHKKNCSQNHFLETVYSKVCSILRNSDSVSRYKVVIAALELVKEHAALFEKQLLHETVNDIYRALLTLCAHSNRDVKYVALVSLSRPRIFFLSLSFSDCRALSPAIVFTLSPSRSLNHTRAPSPVALAAADAMFCFEKAVYTLRMTFETIFFCLFFVDSV